MQMTGKSRWEQGASCGLLFGLVRSHSCFPLVRLEKKETAHSLGVPRPALKTQTLEQMHKNNGLTTRGPYLKHAVLIRDYKERLCETYLVHLN